MAIRTKMFGHILSVTYFTAHLLVRFSYSVQASCDYDFSGERDVVFLFDTSTSVNAQPLVKGQLTGQRLIKTNMVIRPDAVNLAALTFSQEVKVAFNFVGDPLSAVVYECELFAPGGVWQTSIRFTGEMGENLAGGLEQATQLFRTGKARRPQAHQDLIIVSDSHELFSNPEQAQVISDRRQDMMDFGINIYGIGVGEHLNSSVFAELIVSRPCMYRAAELWDTMNLTNTPGALSKHALKAGGHGEWRPVTNTSICVDSCGEDEYCSCMEFSNVALLTSEPQCIEEEEEKQENRPGWNIVLILFFILCGLFGVIALVACAGWSHNRIKDKRHPLRHLERAQSNDPANEYQQQRSAVRQQEEMYQNGIVFTVIQGHSLERHHNTHVNGHRNMELPNVPVDSQSNTYLQADPSIEGSTEGVYANISTPEMLHDRTVVSTPMQTSEESLANGYENEGVINALHKRFKLFGSRLPNGSHLSRLPTSSLEAQHNTPHSASNISIKSAHKSKHKGSWMSIFRHSRSNSRHDYENEETINDLRERGPQQAFAKEEKKSNRFKVGTKKFRNLRSLFENRKEAVMGAPIPGVQTLPASQPAPVSNNDTNPINTNSQVFNVV